MNAGDFATYCFGVGLVLSATALVIAAARTRR